MIKDITAGGGVNKAEWVVDSWQWVAREEQSELLAAFLATHYPLPLR